MRSAIAAAECGEVIVLAKGELSGSNTAWAHPILYRRIEAARSRNPDLRIVVVDPRRTVTAASDVTKSRLRGRAKL